MHLDQEISLKDLFQNLWQARLFVGTGMVIALICAVLFLMIVTPKYKASMIVAPADGYALGDYASSIQYDRMAALPFWRPKDQEGASTDFYRFVYTLRGTAVSEILLKDGSVLSLINKYHEPKIRTAEQLAAYLTKQIRIDPLGATPLRRLSYQHPDAAFSTALLRKLHLVADQMIRRDRRQQSQSRVEYLQRALGKTTHPDHRKGITNLLMQQEHVQMLANLDEAYAAIIVEPASASPKPVWPNKPFIFSVFIMIGGVIGYLLWLPKKKKEGVNA